MTSRIEPTARVEASVTVSEERLETLVIDRRQDVAGFFAGIDRSQHSLIAVEAWTIGMRALKNAQAAAEEARLKDIGGSLLANLDGQLKTHIESQQKQISAVLTRFFGLS